MELNDRFAGLDAIACDYVLASIIAFGGASPEENSMKDCYIVLLLFFDDFRELSSRHTNLCRTSSIETILLFADLINH